MKVLSVKTLLLTVITNIIHQLYH